MDQVENTNIPTALPHGEGSMSERSVLKDLFGSRKKSVSPQLPGSANFPRSVPLSPTHRELALQSPDFLGKHFAPSLDLDDSEAFEQDIFPISGEGGDILTITALFEVQFSEHSLASSVWEDLDISFHAIQYAAGQFKGGGRESERAAPPIIHASGETLLIRSDTTLSPALQKTIEIALSASNSKDTNMLIAAYVAFREFRQCGEWSVTGSCYIGLQNSREVLYPVRKKFTKTDVDTTGAQSSLFCSFLLNSALQHSPFPSIARIHNLTHDQPALEELEADFHDKASNRLSDGACSNSTKATTNIVKSASHGMRPIGPEGRLMTRLQRQTLLGIRKRFQNQSSREWKKCLTDEELYPLFTLGRDECAKEMGVCATWLKVRMRERGIKVWPNRKLLPTNCALFKIKERLAEIADLQAAPSPHSASERHLLEQRIRDLRTQRVKIVQQSCTPAFFSRFVAYEAQNNALDPDWAA
jgi:RWP-RK domain